MFPCSFLIEKGHINPAQEEVKFANMCIDYLNLPAFMEVPSEEHILQGTYALMNYAVLYWVRHLEAGLEHIKRDDQLLPELAESLEAFLDQHWNSPTAIFNISKRNSERLKLFESYTFHQKLQEATVSMRKQLTFFGKMEKREKALDLEDMVIGIRTSIERVLLDTTKQSKLKNMEDIYGENLFRCPRFSCQSFTNGFPSVDERDRHVQKHERPFLCTDQGCPQSTFGFTSESERNKHMKYMHSTAHIDAQEFPTDQDVKESLKSLRDQEQTMNQDISQPPPVVVQDPEPNQEPLTIPRLKGPRKKGPKRDLTCEHCSKTFTKKYNLDSHLKTHSNERQFSCSVCGRAFARNNDRWRHMSSHEEGAFKCEGHLKDGTQWGCGKSFARADILSSHHKSKTGQKCILPFLQEQTSVTT